MAVNTCHLVTVSTTERYSDSQSLFNVPSMELEKKSCRQADYVSRVGQMAARPVIKQPNYIAKTEAYFGKVSYITVLYLDNQ